MGGGGGGGSGSDNHDGGDGGDGIVRVGTTTLTENTNRDLSGDDGSRDGGPGSGGLYCDINRQGFELAAGASIDLRNGENDNTNGNGRLTTFTADQPTISGTVQGGVVTHFQIYPARPRGGLLVM